MSLQNRADSPDGFTLIELLVVVGLIGIMAALLAGGLGGAGKSANLQSAQTMIANVITVARSKAISSQRRTRIVFQTDAGAGQSAERFLHFFAVQQLPDAEDDPKGSTWITLKEYSLPDEVFVLPFSLDEFAGLVATSGSADATHWLVSDGSRKMRSGLFYGDSVSIDLHDGQGSSQYQGVMFTERGTISRLDGSWGAPDGPTDIVVATGRHQSPDVVASGGAPIVLTNANSVRAVLVSTYGVPILVNNREDF